MEPPGNRSRKLLMESKIPNSSDPGLKIPGFFIGKGLDKMLVSMPCSL